MTKDHIVSNSYNNAIEEGFNRYLEERATSENIEIKVDEEALVAEIEEKWLNSELPELDNITPGQYMESLTSLDELMGFFICISGISDVGVPDFLIEKLKAYGKTAADKLYEFVKVSLSFGNSDKLPAISQAIYSIGCLRQEEYKQKLISLLYDTTTDEMVLEAVCAAIAEYDTDIVEDLINSFNNTDLQSVQEHLLICVAEISRQRRYKADEIFYFLKNAFRTISNLKLTVEILGDYGDSRAIQFLRGYVLKNIKELDRVTFNQIRAVIKKLGGEIGDLVYHG